MKKLNYGSILCILAYLALACFSCFWTAESLFIWQPSLTRAGAWLIAIVFYAIASISFSKVIKGFEKNTVFKHGLFASRGGHLFFGLIGLLFFWLIVSLPTNTHTLLYRASIKSVVTTDITRTQGYLQGLKDNNIEIKKINAAYDSKKDKVDAIILRLIAEIDRPGDEGIGKIFNTALTELEAVLGTTFQKIPDVGKSRPQWLTAINYYQKQAYEQLKLYRAQCDEKIKEIKRLMNSSELDNLINKNKNCMDNVSDMDGIDNNVIAEAVKSLEKSYSYINSNSQYINFKPLDEVRYTREGAIPEAKEMLSVPDVWKDYLTTDKYDGHGFIWWVLIAFLVDLAAFIFAYKAFN